MARKSLGYLVALTTVAAACAVAGCRPPAGQAAVTEGPKPREDEAWLTPQEANDAKIQTGRVDEQNVDDTVLLSGRVTFDDLRVAHIYSPVTGRVLHVDANLGQRVKKGQPLATIQSPDIGQASSDLGKADADLIAAQHDIKRQKDLYAVHAASAADFEVAEDNYRKAKAEKERAMQKSFLLRAGGIDSVTQGYTLTAPIDGELIARTISPGAEVAGQYGSGQAVELFTVGELDKVWVMADVFEIDLARIVVGAKVLVTVVGYPGKRFEGRVDWIAGALDPQTRTARVRCIFENPEKLLKPEMYATVQIGVEQHRVLAVPKDAVLRLGDQRVVVLRTGHTAEGKLKFERVPVAVDDIEGNGWIPVLHGLDKGQEIVTSGAGTLTGMMQ